MKRKKRKKKVEKTMTLAVVDLPPLSVLEKVLIGGDLAALDSEQRLNYYQKVCQTLHLNPLTRPFEYITLQGRMILYARKDCTDQLRRIYNISLKIVTRDFANGLCTVTAQARLANGRADEDIGSVALQYPARVRTHDGSRPHPHAGEQYAGDDLANAIMKANTKAKRRVTLSICGLGFYDETELEQFAGDELPATVTVETTPLPPPAQVQPSSLTLTDENYGGVICHVGRAQGEMLGRKVGELKLELLQWLNENFEKKWAKQGATRQDVTLKRAVEIALRKHAKSSEDRAGTVASPADGQSVVAPSATGNGTNTKQLLVLKIKQRAEKELQLNEKQLLEILGTQGLALQSDTGLDNLTQTVLLAIDEQWATLKEASASYHIEHPEKQKQSDEEPFQ